MDVVVVDDVAKGDEGVPVAGAERLFWRGVRTLEEACPVDVVPEGGVERG